ncbi:MAG: formate dehydrogenase family accessory protein FdhD [Flavobacteriales bacterium]|nr:MAG: formate dehydrogenase family accessory protein FdhD [Flavobacteriales bacterium]
MQQLVYEAIKTENKNQYQVKDNLVIEAALQININKKPYTTVMRTPGNDKELTRGLLYAEDICKSENFIYQVNSYKTNHFSVVNITIPKDKLGKGYLNKRTLLSISSCGICGRQTLESVESTGTSLKNMSRYTITQIKNMYRKMADSQILFQATGGCHATAAFDADGNFLSVMEDIGRHNTLDKVIGYLLFTDKLPSAKCITVSGRVSYEVISKAFTAKIPIVVAVSACSSLAVDYAKKMGICLIGFNRGDKATIYSNPQYIKNYE